jgi:hypothetical protein
MMRALALLLALAGSACHSQSPQTAQPATPSPREAEVRKFINTYFESWSTRDLKTYGECFHARSRVWFTDQGPMEKAPFLESQRQAHATSPHPLKEVPLATEVTIKGDLAHVNVYWELDRGTGRVRGYDFFTLVFAQGRWQIIALVFNQES